MQRQSTIIDNSIVQVRDHKFQLTRKLGSGGTSQVWEACTYKSTRGTKYALKLMDLADEESVKLAQTEVFVMKAMKHQNIIRLLDFDMETEWAGKKVAVLVMEVAGKGELFDFLKAAKGFHRNNGKLAHYIFSEVVEAISFMHAQGIVHRDIKPENVLLNHNYDVKIADMGFSAPFISKRSGRRIALSAQLGSKGYHAPEIVTRNTYDESVDIFSLGVVLFILYAGFPPFRLARKGDWWFDKLRKHKYDHFWQSHEKRLKFPEELKTLIIGMLQVDPKDRFGFSEIKSSEWFQQEKMENEAYLKEMHHVFKLWNPSCTASTPRFFGGETVPATPRKFFLKSFKDQSSEFLSLPSLANGVSTASSELSDAWSTMSSMSDASSYVE